MDIGNTMIIWIMPILIITFWGLGFYALILLIKALKIYINKNS
ncbi:hypothetical protein [Clostridium sp.]|nr:hypothetical protein [Clostridium sp.]MDR3598143.1 hypothetical protein [Clostridium sp.]